MFVLPVQLLFGWDILAWDNMNEPKISLYFILLFVLKLFALLSFDLSCLYVKDYYIALRKDIVNQNNNCGISLLKIYNVIYSGDDGGSSESLPRPNNATYRPTVINIGMMLVSTPRQIYF